MHAAKWWLVALKGVGCRLGACLTGSRFMGVLSYRPLPAAVVKTGVRLLSVASIVCKTAVGPLSHSTPTYCTTAATGTHLYVGYSSLPYGLQSTNCHHWYVPCIWTIEIRYTRGSKQCGGVLSIK